MGAEDLPSFTRSNPWMGQIGALDWRELKLIADACVARGSKLFIRPNIKVGIGVVRGEESTCLALRGEVTPVTPGSWPVNVEVVEGTWP